MTRGTLVSKLKGKRLKISKELRKLVKSYDVHVIAVNVSLQAVRPRECGRAVWVLTVEFLFSKFFG